MKIQLLVGAMALATGAWLFGYTASEAVAANETAQSLKIQPNQEQALVSRQIAALADRQHYLGMRLDSNVSQRVFDMYIDSLDPDHALFLASEVADYKQKHAAQFGEYLKQGNLIPAYGIHEAYRARQKEYYEFMLAELKKPRNLHRTGERLNTDREKAPFFSNKKEMQDYWHKQLISQLINLTITKEEEQAKQKALADNPELANGQDLSNAEDLTPVQTLTKRYTRNLERLTKRTKSDDVLDKTLNAVLATYDPHSNYFPPIDAVEMNRQSSLQLEGIGVSIRPERGSEDYIRIETIVEGGPAGRSGQVYAGDRILGVAQDGQPMEDVVGWTTAELVGIIRGKRGTKVTLKLLAKGASQSRLVTLERDIIKEEDSGLRHRTINIQRDGKDYKMGVIEIPSFYFNYRAKRAGNEYRSVSEDTAKALTDLAKQNVDGIIVDLRNNPGGSLEEVNKMLGQIIKSGPVVQIRDGNGRVTVFEDNDGGQQLYGGPLAVLINLGSASASEIYSAAVQDYGRGIVIGSTTTGKGTAQVQLDSLAHGQATLTQRKFYRITGGSTQNKGVIPDIQLVDIYNGEGGESKQKNALVWDTIATAPFKREGSVQAYLPQLTAQSKQRVAKDVQFNYLQTRHDIAAEDKNKKNVSLDIAQRKAELLAVEKRTLAAENTRRTATGLTPYANWESYQAARDALIEERSKMKATQRPALPEDETFVIEASHILLDYVQLQQPTKGAK
ncbi:MAG: carboxy terminal-processing peptidase [Acinetobacter sp.]|nr:carboxy terminal-processing peptidase [Acinetobacter sp.]